MKNQQAAQAGHGLNLLAVIDKGCFAFLRNLATRLDFQGIPYRKNKRGHISAPIIHYELFTFTAAAN